MLAKNWNKCFPGKNPFKSRGKSGLNTQTGRQTITSLVPHHESGTSRCHITSLVPDYQYVSAASTLSSDYRDQLFVLHTGCQNCCKLFCLGELGSAAVHAAAAAPPNLCGSNNRLQKALLAPAMASSGYCCCETDSGPGARARSGKRRGGIVMIFQ